MSNAAVDFIGVVDAEFFLFMLQPTDRPTTLSSTMGTILRVTASLLAREQRIPIFFYIAPPEVVGVFRFYRT
jgi:hypothetical protein